VPYFGVVTFNAIGLALVRHGDVTCRGIDQVAVSGEQVNVVELGLQCLINHGLQQGLGTLESNASRENTTGMAIHKSHDVADVFFLPTKVNSSSNSTTPTSSSCGGCAGSQAL
jgi:hypothetical protein